MRLQHIGHNHYRISDADAGRLAKAVGQKLPEHGYELRVELPDGIRAWLSRSPYRYEKDSPKRGWVWVVFSDEIHDVARLVKDDRWRPVYEMNPTANKQLKSFLSR